MYLLDTNVVSQLGRPLPDRGVLNWLTALDIPHLSVMTLGELRRGFHLLPHGRRKAELEARLASYLLQPSIQIEPVTDLIASRWGELSAARQRIGRPISVPDGLIAATAIEQHLVLVTRNTKDFADLNIDLFNPWLG